MLVGCISIGHDQNNDSKIIDRTDTSDRTVQGLYKSTVLLLENTNLET